MSNLSFYLYLPVFAIIIEVSAVGVISSAPATVKLHSSAKCVDTFVADRAIVIFVVIAIKIKVVVFHFLLAPFLYLFSVFILLFFLLQSVVLIALVLVSAS